MNIFDVHSLTHVMHKLTQVQIGLLMPKMMGQGGSPVPPLIAERAMKAFDEAELLFKAVELQDCLLAVQSARDQWYRPMLDVSAANEIAYRLGLDIVKALEDRQFLRVADDRLSLLLYMRGETPHAGVLDVFGDAVRTNFNSATSDIIEAGNCLAAECNTAAVFHLMRVAEVGLRALANDRNAPFKNKPIDQQEWGTILGYLDGCILQLRQDALSNWRNPGLKDIQIRFYSEVVAELRGFNEAWRRHISHAREDGIYDRDYAGGVFKHVRVFMQKLAEKISESSVTPKYWT